MDGRASNDPLLGALVALQEVDHHFNGGGRDEMAGVGQNAEFADRKGVVDGGSFFDRAEGVAVADE